MGLRFGKIHFVQVGFIVIGCEVGDLIFRFQIISGQKIGGEGLCKKVKVKI